MAAPPPVLTLAVEKGPREGETRQCRAGGALRIGRVVKGNDLAVRDKGASQQHLAIEFLPPPDARWAVSDLGSSNGTLLNGAPLVPSVPAPLSHGDLIKVGDFTVLAVSIASDSDPNPGPTRSSRHAAAEVVPVVEEKPPAVRRRGTRKKAAAAAEPPDAEKEKPDAAPVVVVEEKTQVVTRRGGRKKVDAAGAPGEIQEAVEATLQRGCKKTVEEPEPEKDEEEATVVMHRSRRKMVAAPPEEEEATVATRRIRGKKAAEPPQQEKEEDEALVVARRGDVKKDAVSVAPPLLPARTRSGRGQGRVSRASARNIVLEVDEEQQQGNELAASRAYTGNRLASTAVKGGEMQEGKYVGVGDGEVEGTAKALREEVPKGRASAQPAASGKGVSVTAVKPHEETDEAAEVMPRGRRKKDIKLPELEKEDKEKEEDVTVVTRRGGRKKDMVVTRRSRRKLDEAMIAPPALHATTRPGRGRRRVTRAGQRIIVVDEDVEEEQEVNEVDVPRERNRNDGKEEKVNKVAAGDGKAQWVAKPLEEEVPKGRASAQRVASANGASADVVEPPEEMDNAAVATQRAGWKKDAAVMGRGRRKKDVSTIAPAPLPAKTRSRRGRGRFTRASARNAVLEEEEEEEHEGNEVAGLREQIGNLPRTMAVNVGQEEKGPGVAARDGESQGTAKALEEEVPKGRASAQPAGSCNRGEVDRGGAHCSSRADSGSNGIPNTTSKYREDTKLKAHYTPFDVRLDRALKKYSA